MTYYRVPEELDQEFYNRKKGLFFVVGELYTPGECRKLGIDPGKLDKQEIKKTDTYWFFGCRFQDGKFGHAAY